MRSLYALHPDTVLQLHEHGAAVYGQQLTLSLSETEERLQHENYGRLVVDSGLLHSPEERRALRRIATVHPETEIACLRGRLSPRGDMAFEELARELRGETIDEAPRALVVVGPGDALAAAFSALALATYRVHRRPVLLVETDTVEPVYASRLHLKPGLELFLTQGRTAHPRRWPPGLDVVAAPARPELLLEYGMEPLRQRLDAAGETADIVVRASANLSDRGLVAALTRATDVLFCAGVANPVNDEYRRWLTALAPRAHLCALPQERGLLRLPVLALRGARLWRAVEEQSHGD